MGIVFGLLSVTAWLIGLISISNATAGVFCAATACWLAILVRLHDAQKQHAEMMALLAASVTPDRVDEPGLSTTEPARPPSKAARSFGLALGRAVRTVVDK